MLFKILVQNAKFEAEKGQNDNCKHPLFAMSDGKMQ